jgi:hypothetical protein
LTMPILEWCFREHILWIQRAPPLMAFFYAVAFFSGKSMTHHPIYSTFLYVLSLLF